MHKCDSKLDFMINVIRTIVCDSKLDFMFKNRRAVVWNEMINGIQRNNADSCNVVNLNRAKRSKAIIIMRIRS